VWRNERQWRSFTRSFTLPDNVKVDSIAAHLDKGVLQVQVPKAEEAKTEPKRITVKGQQ
jgi:HSP20 family protein